MDGVIDIKITIEKCLLSDRWLVRFDAKVRGADVNTQFIVDDLSDVSDKLQEAWILFSR